MLTPEDFPPIVFMGADNKEGARIASIREITPMFHRQPSRDWGQLYRNECKRSPAIEWNGGGFASCKVGEQDPVIDALRAASAAADARFIQYLRRLQPEEAAKIVETEMNSEQVVSTDGPFMLLTY